MGIALQNVSIIGIKARGVMKQEKCNGIVPNMSHFILKSIIISI